MNTDDIENKIKEKFPNAEIKITTDGHRFRAIITDETFAPYSKIERESQVNALFFNDFQARTLHALSLKIIVPSEINDGNE